MRFNKLDLNLLVAMDALLQEQSISRAAARLHMTQPAMSKALGRLRDYFDDDLLVQVGRRMELTPYALDLKEAVHDLLQRVKNTMSSRPEFIPSKSDRQFKIFVSDYGMSILMPSVLSQARAQGATATFAFLPQIENPDSALSRGEVDLLILPRDFCAREHPVEILHSETFNCLVWNGSPLAHGSLTLERYASAGHIVMRPPGSKHPSFEAWFQEKQGLKRRTVLETYSFSLAPRLVVGTDMIATVHRRLAEQAIEYLPLVIKEPPVGIPAMEQCMQWHRYRTKDPGITWVRQLLLKAANSLSAVNTPRT